MHQLEKIALCLLAPLLLKLPAAFADMNHQFPGRGSYDKWLASSRIDDQGVAAAKAGHTAEAKRLFRAAISQFADPLYYFNLGVAAESENDYVNAEINLRKSIELQASFQAWDELGIVLAESKNYAGAEKAFSQAAKYVRSDGERTKLKQNQDEFRKLTSGQK